MGDFDPRMAKWGEREVSGLFSDLGDAIFNKGRVERERKAAARRAAKRARWKRSRLGRFTSWVWMWIMRLFALAIMIVALRVLWGFIQVGSWVFGS